MKHWPLEDGKTYQRHRFDPALKREIRALRSDNWHALLAVAEDAVWIAVSIAACELISPWLYPIAALVIGARQRGLSTVLHDSAHGVAAKNRTLNVFLGTVPTGFPIFQRYYAYRASHVVLHHAYLGDPERDPDLRFFIEQGAYDPMSKRRFLVENVLKPLLGSRTVAYLGYLVDNRFKQRQRHVTPPRSLKLRRRMLLDRVAFYVFWATVVAIFGAAGLWWELFIYWVVPYLTSFQILGWYIEMSEHTPMLERESTDLFMTRNRKSRGIEKFLTGIHNDHHHLDHHLDTSTPFWLLPRARQIRLRDPEYARLDAATGGLFTRAPNGAPSAISTIMHSRAAAARRG